MQASSNAGSGGLDGETASSTVAKSHCKNNKSGSSTVVQVTAVGDTDDLALVSQGKNLNVMYGASPSTIDKYSRVIFPVCFTCFHLMYWSPSLLSVVCCCAGNGNFFENSTQNSVIQSNYTIIGVIQTRTYKEINIEWVPPPKVSCLDPSKSGDRGTLPQLDLTRPQFKFSRNKPEVQLADRKDIPYEVKRIASLEFAPLNKQIQVIKHDVLGTVQRHAFDCSSLESAIACLTIKIRNQQRHTKTCRRDVMSRVICKENIDRRNSLLKYLRKADYKRFEWLLEKLDLVYHPHPEFIVPVTRKGSIMKLTNIYCERMRNDRLETYKKELENEKVKFAEEKAEVEKWIEEEEKQLGLRN
uniref:Small ribosomal subunit protein uS15m n=1 Tax=Daphnia hispanica TaxID=575233 RepID=A0A4Y7M3Q8_9CRUS|nr:EOG090X09BQ [Daphnia hispanica]